MKTNSIGIDSTFSRESASSYTGIVIQTGSHPIDLEKSTTNIIDFIDFTGDERIEAEMIRWLTICNLLAIPLAMENWESLGK